ncbi:anti-sigma factor RsbA family regulatory protein [Streptomyces sp. NPDC026673]|uniref:anti-sigma factor RsbA family regulatory protein n=1 Tax=Streptomyces sp. NPDC026673 TaxID=3155724 RepID=UPI0033E0684B
MGGDDVLSEVGQVCDAGPFVHPALFYRNTREYTAGTVPFLLDGIAAGEPVAVAVPPPRLALLRTALGPSGAGVRWIDMERAGRNPGRIIPDVLRAFADTHPDGRVRIVGEPVWPGRTALEYPACAQHEALINLAFAGRPVTILCPYDAALLEASVLAEARATHPAVVDGGREERSARYAPRRVVAAHNRLPERPSGVLAFGFTEPELADARHIATAEARRLGLDGERLAEFSLAAGELITNSVLHGGGSGVVSVWSEGGPDGQVVCEVRDRGHLADPLAGRRPASRDLPHGRGLLMVNRLADLVRQRTGGDGTTIRFYMRR